MLFLLESVLNDVHWNTVFTTNCFQDSTQATTQISIHLTSVLSTALNETKFLALMEFRVQRGKTGNIHTNQH